MNGGGGAKKVLGEGGPVSVLTKSRKGKPKFKRHEKIRAEGQETEEGKRGQGGKKVDKLAKKWEKKKKKRGEGNHKAQRRRGGGGSKGNEPIRQPRKGKKVGNADHQD